MSTTIVKPQQKIFEKANNVAEVIEQLKTLDPKTKFAFCRLMHVDDGNVEYACFVQLSEVQ